MGIKFHCPNGHKLNVKSFLAGKKGVCPKCGTKVRIPSASEPGLEGSDLEETDGAPADGVRPSNGSALEVPAGAPSAAASVPATPAARAEAPPPAPPKLADAPASAPAPASPAPGIAAGGSHGRAVAPLPALDAESDAAGGRPPGLAEDPIAEAPDAIWYVRPPTGGQYGPAHGDTMRKWIAESRVSSDSLVWREGWSDWRTAGRVFHNLQAVGTTEADVALAIASPAARASRTGARTGAKQRLGSGVTVAALVFLALICVVLVAVFVYVLVTLK